MPGDVDRGAAVRETRCSGRSTAAREFDDAAEADVRPLPAALTVFREPAIAVSSPRSRNRISGRGVVVLVWFWPVPVSRGFDRTRFWVSWPAVLAWSLVLTRLPVRPSDPLLMRVVAFRSPVLRSVELTGPRSEPAPRCVVALLPVAPPTLTLLLAPTRIRSLSLRSRRFKAMRPLSRLSSRLRPMESSRRR